MTSVHVQDQIRAASADAAQRIARSLPDATHLTVTEQDRALLRRLFCADTKICKHLTANWLQPWYALGWEPIWRCAACHLANSITAERVGLDPIEDGTCDVCRRYVGRTLTVSVLRFDMLVINLATCRGCLARSRAAS